MKICIAQIQPAPGDITGNFVLHKEFIKKAVSHNADLIVFPELSLTGYEPKLAAELVATIDEVLDDFQKISERENITICIGLPVASGSGIMIGMVIFSPNSGRQIYSKQFLHSDELPYFTNGTHQLIFTIKNEKIAPAICYESLLPDHAKNAHRQGAGIYLASVSKPELGVNKAFKHYPAVAKNYSMVVVLCNSIGPCDKFIAAGCSAVWDNKGSLVGQLDDINEGILIYNMETNEVQNII